MRELTETEVDSVHGGLGWDAGALAIMGLGITGGPVTAGFGVAIGLSMLGTSAYGRLTRLR
ncbi:MAG: hypothetical protein U5R48_14560 [Gammaproteobacteria bacterium]|nr:hypothetical protein [Gammaproteobacteria bacterium]